MALNSLSLLSPLKSSSSISTNRGLNCSPKPCSSRPISHKLLVRVLHNQQHDTDTPKIQGAIFLSFLAESSSSRRNWGRAVVSTALAAAAAMTLGANMPLPAAMADLNKFEAEQRGEFGIGSAAQFGSADLKKTVHTNENFRRANFTSADMRESDFSGSTFNGAYLEKAVAYKANFSGADLSDTLMDRMVLNEANLTNAVLVRTVLTRSDLGGALIEGADFSDAVLDLTTKQALCKYASGTNPMTGVSTRVSLGCGNSRRNAYGSPSSPLISAPPQKLLDRDGFCDSASGLCDAK